MRCHRNSQRKGHHTTIRPGLHHQYRDSHVYCMSMLARPGHVHTYHAAMLCCKERLCYTTSHDIYSAAHADCQLRTQSFAEPRLLYSLPAAPRRCKARQGEANHEAERVSPPPQPPSKPTPTQKHSCRVFGRITHACCDFTLRCADKGTYLLVLYPSQSLH